MSVLVECSMGELNGERKPLFPLFQKSPRPQNSSSEQESDASPEILQDKPPNDFPTKDSASSNKRSNNVVKTEALSLKSIDLQAQAHSLDVDPNESRKKRRKTSTNVQYKATGDYEALVNGGDESTTRPEEGVRLEETIPLPTTSALALLSAKPTAQKRERKEDDTQHLLQAPYKSDFNKNIIQMGNAFPEPTSQRSKTLSAEAFLGGYADSTSPSLKPNVSQLDPPASDAAFGTSAPTVPIVVETRPKRLLKFNPKTGTIGSPPKVNQQPQDIPSSTLLGAVAAPLRPDTANMKTVIGNLETKPRKVLYFNTTTGTIGSPPKKVNNIVETTSKKMKRGKQPKSLVVRICYSQRSVAPLQPKFDLPRDDAVRTDNHNDIPESEIVLPSEEVSVFSVGQRIDRIQNNEERFVLAGTEAFQTVKVAKPKPVKSTHPLFLDVKSKIQKKRDTPDRTMDLIDLTELGSKKPTEGILRRRGSFSSSLPSHIGHSSPIKRRVFEKLGESTKILKFPGAMEPAWPWKGMVHINPDLTAFKHQSIDQVVLPDLRSMNEKWKTHAVALADDEDILNFISGSLDISHVARSIREIDLDMFPPIPSCLRIPKKLHESGSGIQSRVQKQLRSRMSVINQFDCSSSEDELRVMGDHTVFEVHPGLTKIYASIPKNPPAFDRGQCETQAWPQKYAPERADQVLQTGPEVLNLKAWLISQTVNSVEITASESKKTTAAKKRKRKLPKPDEFIVFTDEEGDDEQSKIKNTVLITGRHGCGKTAAVYAVAKELGFEVFEINSGSRRSGKDIYAKIGDMIGNHLVQGARELTAELPIPQLDGTAEDRRVEFENDLKTGRQGTLNTFFVAKPANTKSGAQNPVQIAAKESRMPVHPTPISQKKQATLGNKADTKAPSKEQKQSLILIEEADVIYKQDSQFWSMIEKLQDISRRPIILTCNDENAIPLCRESLHAVLRFTPPPVELAVDYMLLIAASEGHLIKRKAARTLYEGRNLDLRASLMELNFWCQFAVGDENRGLGWYYPRTRGRQDVDENGHAIRVVSKGTYQNGMGWLSQDILKSRTCRLGVKDELLHEACASLNLDLGDWERTLNINSWVEGIEKSCDTKQDRLLALNMFSNFTDNMSDADVLSEGLFASQNQILRDATQPSLWETDSEEYPIAYHAINSPEHHILHAPEAVTHSHVAKDIGLFVRSRGRHLLHIDPSDNHHLNTQEFKGLTESHILKLICKQTTSPTKWLSHDDLSLAFKPFRPSETINQKCDTPQFKSTQRILTEDLAPFVRSIVAYDGRLQKEREKISNLLSEGGRPGKRQRTTRAAFSAMAGSARSQTRKERWFWEFPDLNPILVLCTAGDGWSWAALEDEMEQKAQLGDTVVEEEQMEE